MLSLIISARTPFPLLTAPGNDYTGPSILSSVAEIVQKTIEPAGNGYLRLQKQRLLLKSNLQPSSSTPITNINKPSDIDDNDDNDEPPTTDEKKRMMLLMENGNHYEILGLGSLNINATDEQIKKAYRKLVLKYNPDKGNTPSTLSNTPTNTKSSSSSSSSSSSTTTDEKTDPLFLAIRTAYEVLSNEEKRRTYDSQFEFDDSIPTGNEKGDFFTIYGPVFERNGRFSENKPVPKLGTINDPDEKVMNFYKFWFNFESWRDFSNLGEHDLNKAEYRDEKRWMERQNKNAVSKAKKAENARVQELVNRAYLKDPRVIAMKAKEEEEKQRIRDEKAAAKAAIEAAKRKAEEEAAAKAAAEAEQLKAEQLAAKAAREAEKKLYKRFRTAFKKLVPTNDDTTSSSPNPSSSPSSSITEADVEYICNRLSIPALYTLHTEVYGETATNTLKAQFDRSDATPVSTSMASSPIAVTKENIHTFLNALKKEKDTERAELLAKEEAMKNANNTSSTPVIIGKKEEIEWTPQELSMLAKAMAKFPGGTRNRWLAVANVVNSLGQINPRTQDECIAKAHKIEEEKKKINSQVFNIAMTSRRAEVELRDRDAQPTTTAMKSIVTSDGKMVMVPVDKISNTNVVPPILPNTSSETPVTKPSTPITPINATNTPTSASTTSTPVVDGNADSEAGIWTPEQQTALEAALKKYPASLDKNERWKLIAEAVPGKTKKQCVARFKDIREKVKASVNSTEK